MDRKSTWSKALVSIPSLRNRSSYNKSFYIAEYYTVWRDAFSQVTTSLIAGGFFLQ